MIRIRKSRVLIGVGIVVALVIGLALFLPQAALADGKSDVCSSYLNGYTGPTQDNLFVVWQADWTWWGCGAFPNGPDSCTTLWGYVDGHAVYAKVTATTCDEDSCSGSWIFIVDGCEPATAQEAAPSIFLSDVCQPNDGFGDDGYMTLDTDAGSLGVLPQLYYGPSADGPWMTLEVNGPPYNLTQADLTAMAAAAGLSDYTELWVKAGEAGRAMHLGKMIEDRAARMDEICGG